MMLNFRMLREVSWRLTLFSRLAHRRRELHLRIGNLSTAQNRSVGLIVKYERFVSTMYMKVAEKFPARLRYMHTLQEIVVCSRSSLIPQRLEVNFSAHGLLLHACSITNFAIRRTRHSKIYHLCEVFVSFIFIINGIGYTH